MAGMGLTIETQFKLDPKVVREYGNPFKHILPLCFEYYETTHTEEQHAAAEEAYTWKEWCAAFRKKKPDNC